jgi:thioredoxin-dependent peroxiredoxin
MIQSEGVDVVDVGDVAPDFTLEGTGGQSVTLSAVQGRLHTLLIFYPKDFTGG